MCLSRLQLLKKHHLLAGMVFSQLFMEYRPTERNDSSRGNYENTNQPFRYELENQNNSRKFDYQVKKLANDGSEGSFNCDESSGVFEEFADHSYVRDPSIVSNKQARESFKQQMVRPILTFCSLTTFKL